MEYITWNFHSYFCHPSDVSMDLSTLDKKKEEHNLELFTSCIISLLLVPQLENHPAALKR